MENFGIPGLVYAGNEPPTSPILLVTGLEKAGKSSTAISLIGWPEPGNYPLILAFDAAGVDSCVQLGHQMPCIKVKDQPGVSFWQKTQGALGQIEAAFRTKKPGFPFTSIVVDCGSTMTDKFLQEASKGENGTKRDKRHAYGDVLDQSSEVLSRLEEIGVPQIWFSWVREGYKEEIGSGRNKTVKFHLGGPLMSGNFKGKLGGKAAQILLLEKSKTGGQGADAQGYTRQFRTRTYNNIEAGGRYSQYLPDPCPAHLGFVLDQIMTRGAKYGMPVAVNPAAAPVAKVG